MPAAAHLVALNLCAQHALLVLLIMALYDTRDVSRPSDLFCENVTSSTLFAQPVNAWSAFSYQFVAWMCVLWGAWPGSRDDSPMTEPFLISLVGIGSIAFHGLFSLWGGILDVCALVLYLNYEFFAIVYPFALSPAKHAALSCFYAFVCLILIYAAQPRYFDTHFQLWLPVDTGTPSLGVFVAFVGTIFVGAIVNRDRDRPQQLLWLLLAVIFLLVGACFWLVFHSDCAPGSPPGHAIWHTSTALAMGCLFAMRQVPLKACHHS